MFFPADGTEISKSMVPKKKDSHPMHAPRGGKYATHPSEDLRCVGNDGVVFLVARRICVWMLRGAVQLERLNLANQSNSC